MTPDPATSPPVDLGGVFIPVTTPFEARTGDFDAEALAHNLERWLRTPVRGILIGGTTGEAVLLESGERRRAMGVAREHVPSNRLLLCGTGAESTRATIQRTKEAAADGADAVLVQPPGFYRALMDGRALADHFRAVADAARIPVLLYRVPSSCSSVELAAGLVAELSSHPNIVGIKDSSGNLDALGSYVTQAARNFQVLVGSGSKLYAALEIGAVGGILGVANLAASEAAAIAEAFEQGRVVEAGRIQERIAHVNASIVAKRGVPGVKAALDLLGYRGGSPRLPLRACDRETREEIRTVLTDGGLLDSPEGPE